MLHRLQAAAVASAVAASAAANNEQRQIFTFPFFSEPV